MNAREIAFKTVYDVIYNDKYSNTTLENYIKHSDISNVDRGFCTMLTMGTIQRYISFQFIIKELSSLKYNKISKSVKVILSLAMYQHFYMDKIPTHAICNESTKMALKFGGKHTRGFVNALSRKITTMAIPEIDNMSYKYSFNEKIINELKNDYSIKEIEEIFSGINNYSITLARLNTFKDSKENIIKSLNDEGFIVEFIKNNCISLKGNLNPTYSKCYKEGLITIQDVGAQEMVEKMGIIESDKVLDVCAAPGGKTSYIGQLLKNESEIIACDIHESRVIHLKKEMQRMGLKNVKCICHDMTILKKEYTDKFDKILLDAPCSGIGVSKKRPEIRIKYDGNSELVEIQKKLINTCSKYLKIGGRLMYGTCTMFKSENENIISSFLDENEGFELISDEMLMPSGDNMGFYMAVIERK